MRPEQKLAERSRSSTLESSSISAICSSLSSKFSIALLLSFIYLLYSFVSTQNVQKIFISHTAENCHSKTAPDAQSEVKAIEVQFTVSLFYQWCLKHSLCDERCNSRPYYLKFFKHISANRYFRQIKIYVYGVVCVARRLLSAVVRTTLATDSFGLFISFNSFWWQNNTSHFALQ